MIQALLTNLRFELGLRKRQVSAYVYFLIFFGVGFLFTLLFGGAFQGFQVIMGGSEQTFVNSPYMILTLLNTSMLFGLFILPPFFGQALYRDFGCDFEEILYSTPSHRKGLLMGRFLGAFTTLLLIFGGFALGIYLATWIPMIQEKMLGPNAFSFYLMPFLVIIIPNFFIFGSFFFLLVSKTKNMASTYVLALVAFVAFILFSKLSGRYMEYRFLIGLLDPLGWMASGEVTRNWSVYQQNNQVVPLVGSLLYNRIIWLSLGLGCFLTTLMTFNIHRKKGRSSKQGEAVSPESPRDRSVHFYRPQFKKGYLGKLFVRQFRFEFGQIFKSVHFQILTLAGVVFCFVAMNSIQLSTVASYPVTYQMMTVASGQFGLFIAIILIFFAGESVWRDRDRNMNLIVDATPAPSWILALTKYLSFLLIVAFLSLVVIGCSVVVQTFSGYFHYEWGVYAKMSALNFLYYALVIALAFFIQAMVNNRYVGYGLMIAYFFLSFALPKIGFEHKLYRYGTGHFPTYSDMNGYGRFIWPHLKYQFYWASLAGLLIIASLLFWQRGLQDVSWSERIRRARERFRFQYYGMAALLCLFSFGTLGSIIFYNTNIQNTYRTTGQKELQKYNYEKKYKQYQNVPQPSFTSVKVFVDIFPHQGRMFSRASFGLKNKTDVAIDTLYLNINTSDRIDENIQWSVPILETKEDKELGFMIVKLVRALGPGEEFSMDYELTIDHRYFANSISGTDIVGNGTFFNNNYYPSFGYNSGMEISSTKTRKKYGLEEQESLPDKKINQKNIFKMDLVEFEATLGTSSDQIAVAPGYLVKKWKEKGRNYYQYKMDHKILNFYSFVSAKYEVLRDKWKDVNIEIYYHKTHDKNLDRMIQSIKMSLDYFTKHFGPYQHKQFRILEFPRYRSFAQSFPNTVPYSEAVGFIAKVDEKDPYPRNDVPFYITSHELAHQWWPHQVIGAYLKGGNVMSESFAEYSALMVMKKHFGHHKMKKFLKYNTDQYFFGRKKEPKVENPLYRSDFQNYLDYSKGASVMYALQDYVGEEVVNRAFREYLNTYPIEKEHPYPTTEDFVAILKKNISPQYHPLIEDFFKKIVLFDNKVIKAEYRPTENDKYEVTITFEAKKLYADGLGKETPSPFKQDIYFGVQDVLGNFLYLAKREVSNGQNTIRLVVDAKPHKVGIDPLHILIDKQLNDNVISVKKK